jgi:hypothetical protein
MANIRSVRDCTEFQLFVLTYLYGVESEDGPNEQTIVTRQELAELTPHEVLPGNGSKMFDELSSLVESNLLVDTWTDQSLNRWPLGGYHLDKVDGVIFVRKYLGGLVPEDDQSQIENVIDKTSFKTEVKRYFTDLFNKLKEKSQEEIASGLLSGAKKYGLAGIIYLIKMVMMQHHTDAHGDAARWY